MSIFQGYVRWRAIRTLDHAARLAAAGDAETALGAYRRAAGLRRAPKRLKAAAHRGAADALSRLGRLGEAMPHLRALVDMGGGAPALRRLAKALRAQGAVGDEIKVWQEILKADRSDLAAHDRLADVYIQLGQPARAVAHARLVAKAAPLAPRPWKRMAGVLAQVGDWRAASDAARRVAALTDQPDAVVTQSRNRPAAVHPTISPADSASRAINVAIASPGLQVFQVADLPNVRTFPLGADGAPDPDLIVFPFGTTRACDRSRAAADRMMDILSVQVGRRGVAVVLDSSTEGKVHNPERSAMAHEFLSRLGVPARRGVYLTQDRNYRGAYLTHCAERGLRRPMTVLTYDSFIWRTVGQFDGRGEDAFQERLEAFQARVESRERRFMSLNFTLRPHKILFLLSLLRDDLWDNGYISLGGVELYSTVNRVPREALADHLAELEGFSRLARELAPFIDALDAKGRQLFGAPEVGKLDPNQDVTLPEYGRSWFSVVTETEMNDRPTRITEKPLKPLTNFHPYLVLGNPGALRMIRDLGFATFDDIFDESYDDELDPRRRFDMVYRQMRQFCATDETKLAKREKMVADKLIFNANWGMTKLPGVWRRRALSALVDDMLAAVGRSQA